MEFKITSHEYADLAFSPAAAPDQQSYLLEGASPIIVNAPFGSMVFQEIQTDRFTIWYSNYFLKEKMHFFGAAEQEVLELTIVLQRELNFVLGGIGTQELKSGQFTLTYTPYIENKSVFEHAGTYTTFDIHLEPAFLKPYAEAFAPVALFMEQLEKKKPCRLLNQYFTLSTQIRLLLSTLLDNPYQGLVRKIFIDTKISELVFLLFESTGMMSAGAPHLKPHEINGLQEVKRVITMHFDETLSVPALAKKAGINELKLKRGFKQLFGMSVHSYIIQTRLEHAKYLLVHTKELITHIAYKTGYRHVNHFSNAFTKQFGISPFKFRSGKAYH